MTLKDELGKLTDEQMRGIITANLNQPGTEYISFKRASEEYPGLMLPSYHFQCELLARGYDSDKAEAMAIGFTIGMRALIKAAEIEQAQAEFPDMPTLPENI